MKRKQSAGFSLVELIVVLLIISILSTVVAVSLVGYIQKSRNAAYMQEAKLCVTGVQSALAESYAFHPPAKDAHQIFSGATYGDARDADCASSEIGRVFAQKADDLFERKPYMLIVGLGDYDTYKNSDFEKTYQPYIIIYWPDKNTYPLFYNGSAWTEIYPWNEQGLYDGNNSFHINGETIKVQFYFVTRPESQKSASAATADCWNEMKKAVRK